MMNLKLTGILFSSALIFLMNPAIAGVQISSTRIIYPEGVDEVQQTVKNTGENNQLVQAWVDNIDKKDQRKSPFVVTPPLFKLAGRLMSCTLFLSIRRKVWQRIANRFFGQILSRLALRRPSFHSKVNCN